MAIKDYCTYHQSFNCDPLTATPNCLFKPKEFYPERDREFKDTNPKAKAATTRLDLSLVPDSLDVYAALGFVEGDAKYGGYNYRALGVRVSTYVAALRRHLLRFNAGEWADTKTKVPHLASMAACLAIIIDGFVQGNIEDDRPPFQPEIIKQLAEAEEIVGHLYENFLNEELPRVTEKLERMKNENLNVNKASN